MTNKQLVSYIIVNWNHKDLLIECIASIYNISRNIMYETIIIDNASTDGSVDYIKQTFPEVILIQNNTNLGYARAINQGAGISKGNFIFLLNNDVKLMKNTTERLVSFFSETPDAGAVAPLLYYPDGRFQISCRRFPSLPAIFLEYFGIDKIGPFYRWKLKMEEHIRGGIVPQPMTSALMIRRECWDAVGPFDERFPIFFNDVDWCYRVYKNSNYKIYLCPDVKVIHHLGASASTLGFKKKKEFYKGLIRFYLKHFPFKAEMSL